MSWFKIKAGALQITLFISIVIALLLTTFILWVHTHKQFQIQTDFIIETVRNADKGIDYALRNATPLIDTTTVELNDEDFKTLKINRNFWGIFERISVISQIKNNHFQKTALIGGTQIPNNRTALYVQDNNKPLVLVGNTKIEGVAYVPKQGIKSGTISGQSYYGSQLIYGTTRVSSNLPKILKETDKHLRTIDKHISKISKEHYLNLESGKTYRNSFLEPTQVFFSNNDMHLNSIQLAGNIIAQSRTKIIIDAAAILKDVVLIAPEIEIENNVTGSFQAIASKKITVNKNVNLAYPSALVLKEHEVKQKKDSLSDTSLSKMVIEENTTIKGVLLYLGTTKNDNHKVQLELKENSLIEGEVYCNQNIELKGAVLGTVYANNFIANQSGSIYQNHIYNGTININELKEEYIGLPFNNSKKGVLKWLY